MSGGNRPAERIEIKYPRPLSEEGLLAAWLDHVCARDPNYPSGTVNSIYFDTPRLALYEGKRSSDYVKVKIRLRWYGEDERERGAAFLESKVKEGKSVRKAREEMLLPGKVLGTTPVPEDLVEELQARAERLTGVSLGLLRPVCLVRYRRRRYLDGRTGSRVALDGELMVYPAGSSAFPAVGPVLLDVAVLEVKGAAAGERHFPHLFPGGRSPSLPVSFSKYGAGIEALRRGGFGGHRQGTG